MCNTCNQPSTYDPKRYPGGDFCENPKCPAYQPIPKEQSADQFDEMANRILHSVMVLEETELTMSEIKTFIEKMSEALRTTAQTERVKALEWALETTNDSEAEVCCFVQSRIKKEIARLKSSKD